MSGLPNPMAPDKAESRQLLDLLDEPPSLMPPRSLAMVISMVVFIVMIGLGLFIIDRYRALQLNSLGEIGAVYVEKLLAPYALAQFADDPVAEAMRAAIGDVIVGGTGDAAAVTLRIWAPDGALLFSSLSADTSDHHDPGELRVALAGQAIARLEFSGPEGEVAPLPYPYFEIYVPIHDPKSGQLVAVGEIYQSAAEILRDRAFVERTVWAATALATLGLLALLALSVRQSERLEARLAFKRRMMAQNDQLRRDADQARLDAAQSNEQVLNQVGADLHDGPIQVLGLMSLMSEGGATRALPDGTTLAALTRDVLSQLRGVSAGLILPEMEQLDLRGVIELATTRHRSLTGQDTDLQIGSLPGALDAPRKACLFRVIQEGLSNAARHGEGGIPALSVTQQGTDLSITIRNCLANHKPSAGATPMLGLGLNGMRRRLDAFGGKCQFETVGQEAVLSVLLPLGHAPQ